MIVRSEIVADARQHDGRRQIIERHMDQLEQVHDFGYLADADTDVTAIMAARATVLAADLQRQEVEQNLSLILSMGAAAATGTLTFNYSTEADNIGAMADRATSLTPWQTVQLAQFMSALPDDTLTTMVGLTPDQVTALRMVVAQGGQALAAQGQVIAAIAGQVGA